MLTKLKMNQEPGSPNVAAQIWSQSAAQVLGQVKKAVVFEEPIESVYWHIWAEIRQGAYGSLRDDFLAL